MLLKDTRVKIAFQINLILVTLYLFFLQHLTFILLIISPFNVLVDDVRRANAALPFLTVVVRQPVVNRYVQSVVLAALPLVTMG